MHTFIAQNLPKYHYHSLDYTFLFLTVSSIMFLKENLGYLSYCLERKVAVVFYIFSWIFPWLKFLFVTFLWTIRGLNWTSTTKYQCHTCYCGHLFYVASLWSKHKPPYSIINVYIGRTCLLWPLIIGLIYIGLPVVIIALNNNNTENL